MDNVEQANPRIRLRVVQVLVVACFGLIAWIILLGLTLPKRYDAAHWNLAWIGFDVALLVGLAATAWAAWRRRAIIVIFATITATLMCADAWFDITTARSTDLGVSIVQAVFVELPFAYFLFHVVGRVIRFSRGTLWSDQLGTRPRSLWTVEFRHPSEQDRVSASGQLGNAAADESLD
jgi:hypothetical protein